MKELELKLLLVCALTLFVCAPLVLADWDPQDGHKMHYPQLPDPCGFDVAWTNVWALGDDWTCSEDGLVDDIHFWVSFKYGIGDPCAILNFNVEIWSNDPCGISDPCDVPWSHPDNLLWMYVNPPFTWRYVPTYWQGWFDPYWWDYWGQDHIGCFQVNITDIDQDPCGPGAFEQVQGETYWLVINDVVTLAGIEVGWKESGSDHYMDDAVWGDGFFPPWWEEIRDPCTFESMDLAFVITGGELPVPPKEPVPDLKWSQPPIEYDPTETDPRYCGWNEVAFTNDPCNWWRVAADDFRCFGSMPIDSIHWWGSYLWWEGDEPPSVAGIDPPIIGWRLGFWSNVPADQTGADPCWSHPEMLLWQIEVDAARVEEERVGIDDHPIEFMLDTCFQYYVDLEPDEIFWQEDFLDATQDDVFWLSIAAIYPGSGIPPDPCFPDPCDPCVPPTNDPCYPWGWKTRPWSWMDDAVVFELYENPQEGMLIDPFSTFMYPLYEFPGESYDLAFELDTDPNWIKWDQPFTGIRDWPHYEDIPSWMELWDVPYHLTVAADDWPCTSPLPVTALAWWGSYLGYQYQPCDPCFVNTHPEPPAYFDVSIWTDVPAGADPDPGITWSHPGEIVWQYDVYDYDEVLVGYDKHPEDPCQVTTPGREPVFRYTARIPDPNWFWQEEDEAVYWLSIVAVYLDHFPQYEWGWTNHQHVYNDDAVQTPEMTDPSPGMTWQWNEVYDQTGASADLSFTIYTDPYAEQPVEELDFGDAPDDPCAPMYPTLLVNNGARHIIDGPWFGGQGLLDPCDVTLDVPDPETDGQPDPQALGDDNDGNDDEDGVRMVTLTQGVSTAGTIFEVSGPGGGANVFAWIDYNGDSDWDDPGELIFSGFLVNGIWGLPITAPVGSVVGQTFARWRISSAGGLTPTGLAADGEVEDHEVTIEYGLDFGDAPDDPCTPMYPTLLVNNGARHNITGPWFGPADDAPDAEGDGQPDADALGDDNDAQGDDEDGITIPTLIQNTIINITVEVAGGPAYVHGWIDFNDDGDWSDAGELIINGTLLPNGLNPVPVTVPNNAAVGETFARFRIVSGIVPSVPTGLWSDGEVEDHKVTIEAKRKWSQPPVIIDPGDPPTYFGWDELSIRNGPQIVADDWPCEDYRPVSDVHWWGSYQYWDIPVPPAIVPIGFHIGIWTDVPAGADPLVPWSHPKKMIWEYNAGMAEVNEQFVGWDTYPQYPFDACFRYDLHLPEDNWYWQDPNYAVHWISIAAIYPGDYGQYPWGWKTREHFFNDDAVRFIPTAPNVGSSYIDGVPIVDPCGVSMDMAFELTTHECYPVDDQHHQTWLNLGAPQCWCYQYNCKGDTDNIGTGRGVNKKWVVLADLQLLGSAWVKPESDPLLPVNYQCANFDRVGTGRGVSKKWVVLGDLQILGGGWVKPVSHSHFATNPCPGW